MLRKETERQQSFHCLLYDKIPEDHLLKKVDRAVDFSFINELLEGSYCKNFGRPAKEPELMMKLLFLQYLYGLSDVRVIEEASYNLVYLWFLGLQDRGRFSVLAVKDTEPSETTEKVVFLSHYSHVVTVKFYELE